MAFSLGTRRRPVHLDSREYFAPSKPHPHILFGWNPTRTWFIFLIVLISFACGCGGGSSTPHAFNFSDGSYPLAPMIQAKDGFLYGTAFSGGPGSNAGEVFKIDLNGNFAVLHAFDGPDGFEPETGLFEDTDGYFYGITPTGGVSPSSLSLGVIYRMDAQGNVTVLHSFNAAQPGSYYPRGGIVRGSDGNLYGVTQAGGANQSGVIFKLAHP